MNLPNYFLADLPSEAVLTSTMLLEACQTLKRNRSRYLQHRTTLSLIKLIAGVADSWRAKDNTFRKLALERAEETGFTSPTLARGLDDFFASLTTAGLEQLVQQDLGGTECLDTFCSMGKQPEGGRRALARGPEMLVQIVAGNIPNPALMSMVLGLLVRSAQVVKCASGAALLPRLFAHSIYEVEPKLGACIEVAEWRGGNASLEDVLFEQADCVTVTGSDETLAELRKRVPMKTRFVGYGHKVSFAFISLEMLSGLALRSTVAKAADDVVAWNQLGCLSPHVFYVQDGGTASPELFAEALAGVLEAREASEPRGGLKPESAGAIANRRSIYELRAAHNPGTRLWCSKDSTAWSVVYEDDPRFQFSCLNRFVYVKPVKDLTEALENADMVAGKVSTVGVATSAARMQEIAVQLASWGVSRICPLGQMQRPPAGWRHDGRPPLGELVLWTDWERDDQPLEQ